MIKKNKSVGTIQYLQKEVIQMKDNLIKENPDLGGKDIELKIQGIVAALLEKNRIDFNEKYPKDLSIGDKSGNSKLRSKKLKLVGVNSGEYLKYINCEKKDDEQREECLVTGNAFFNFLENKNYVTEKNIRNIQYKPLDFFAYYAGYQGWNDFSDKYYRQGEDKIPEEKEKSIIFTKNRIGILIAIIAFVLGIIYFPNDEKATSNIQNVAFKTTTVKDSLRVLVTKFEADDFDKKGYALGRKISSKINLLAERDSLPIKAIYREDIISPEGFNNDTKFLIEGHQVDLLLYGNRYNYEKSLSEGKAFIKHEVSDSLYHQLSNFEKDKRAHHRNKAQEVNIFESLEEDKLVVYNETFENWLKGVASYKLGLENIKLFYINTNLPDKEKAQKYFERSNILKYNTREAYNDLIKAVELDSTHLEANKELCKKWFKRNPNGKNYCNRLVKLDSTAENYIYRGVNQLFNSSDGKGGYYRSKKYIQLVVDNFEKALLLEPKNPKVYLSVIKFISDGGLYAGFGELYKNDSLTKFYINKGVKLAEQQYGVDNSKNKLLAEMYDARSYFRFGQNDSINGLKDLELAIKYNPKNSYYRTKRVDFYKKKNNHKKVLEGYQEAIQVDPKNYYLYIQLGDYFKRLNQLDSTIFQYKKMIPIKPEKAYEFIGDTYLLKKDVSSIKKAIEYDKKLIELDDKNSRYYYGIIRKRQKLYSFQKKKKRKKTLEEILNDYDRYLRLTKYQDTQLPRYLNSTFKENPIYFKHQLQVADSMILKYPSKAHGYLQKVKLLTFKKEYQQAIFYSKEAIYHNVNNYAFYPKIIDLYLLDKDTVSASNYFFKYEKLQENGSDIIYKKYDFSKRLHKTNKTLEYGKKYANLKATNHNDKLNVLSYLIAYCQENKEEKEVHLYINKLIEIKPTHPLLKNVTKKQIVKVLEKKIKEKPTSIHPFIKLSDYYESIKSYDEQIKLLKRIKNIHPENRRINKLLKDAEKNLKIMS